MLRSAAVVLAVSLGMTACIAGRERPVRAVTIADFVGSYRGSLAVSPQQAVPMSLDVAALAPDRYSFRLRYGEQPVRDYVLLVDDEAAGRCRMDEQNGIVLPVLFRGGELVSVFAVRGATLVVRYRLQPGGLDFALESFDQSLGEPAGNGVVGIADVACQRAHLHRL